jgi:hypothetical protein
MPFLLRDTLLETVFALARITGDLANGKLSHSSLRERCSTSRFPFNISSFSVSDNAS